MATTSEVIAGLNDIAVVIRDHRQKAKQCKTQLLASHAALVALPTTFTDVINTIDGYTPNGAFEEQAQAEKAALQAEFVALRNTLNSINTDLAAYDLTQ